MSVRSSRAIVVVIVRRLLPNEAVNSCTLGACKCGAGLGPVASLRIFGLNMLLSGVLDWGCCLGLSLHIGTMMMNVPCDSNTRLMRDDVIWCTSYSLVLRDLGRETLHPLILTQKICQIPVYTSSGLLSGDLYFRPCPTKREKAYPAVHGWLVFLFSIC
jgi:hypothetical protein